MHQTSSFDTIIDGHIQKKKKNINSFDEGDIDMVYDLLAFYSEETKVNELDDLQNPIKLTRDDFKAIIMRMIFRK